MQPQPCQRYRIVGEHTSLDVRPPERFERRVERWSWRACALLALGLSAGAVAFLCVFGAVLGGAR